MADDLFEDVADGAHQGLLGTGERLVVLQLCEGLFDRVQIGRRQAQEMSACVADGAALLWLERLSITTTSSGARVVATTFSTQVWKMSPLNGRRRPRGRRSGRAGGPRRTWKRPVPEQGAARQTRVLRRLGPQRRHVGLHPGLVDEHQAAWIDPALMALSPHPPPAYVRAIALVRHQRLLLKLKPQARKKRRIVSWPTATPRRALKTLQRDLGAVAHSAREPAVMRR